MNKFSLVGFVIISCPNFFWQEKKISLTKAPSLFDITLINLCNLAWGISYLELKGVSRTFASLEAKRKLKHRSENSYLGFSPRVLVVCKNTVSENTKNMYTWFSLRNKTLLLFSLRSFNWKKLFWMIWTIFTLFRFVSLTAACWNYSFIAILPIEAKFCGTLFLERVRVSGSGAALTRSV